MNRRSFLKSSFLFTTAIITPTLSKAYLYEKRLRLYHIHTSEHIDTTFWVDGEYIFEELDRLEIFLRDYKTDEIHPIDIDLIEYLYSIKETLKTAKEFNVLSAYRSLRTNSYLRKHTKGVAKNSFHTFGKAIDINIYGYSLSTLKNVALHLKKGGVGFYPKSHFLHIDTGKFRYWRYPKI